MKKVKEHWLNPEFDGLGWHDGRLYSITVPDEDFKLKLDIDYIFEWERKDNEVVGFWVSPCDLIFFNVANFKMEINYKDGNLLFVSEIRRSNERLTPNKKYTQWDFEIECDNGMLSFSATGFEQHVRKRPVLSETQDLDKNR